MKLIYDSGVYQVPYYRTGCLLIICLLLSCLLFSGAFVLGVRAERRAWESARQAEMVEHGDRPGEGR